MIRLLTADEVRNLAGDTGEAGFGSIETAEGCLPLTALEIDADIEGLAARTTVRQQFRNVFAEPLEATYIFPLPPRAAVTGFRMTVDDEIVEGRIDERGQARADYAAALAAGRTASIAEQERADVFSLRVGNIPARAVARIELTLAAPVAVDSLEATYRFPLVVAPRYCPGSALDGDSVGDGIHPDTDLVPDASRISPPVLLPGFKSPVRLGIRVRVAAGSVAVSPGCETGALGCTLPARETIDGDGSLIVTVEPGQRLDRDLIVRFGIAADTVATTALFVEPDAVRPAGLGSGQAAHEAPGTGTFSLVIVPPAPEAAVKQPPRDVVFLLDRSGSMGGWKIMAARRAVARMVDTLTPADGVTVLAFDNVVEHGGETARLLPATDRHRWSLLEWLAGMEARGGTELGAAFEAGLAAFRTPGAGPAAAERKSGRDRLLVLITDCQVGDEDRVLAKLAKNIGDASLFVVGIDTAVNEGLLTRMAESTGGMFEMVESEHRLDEVMDRIHDRLATPLVSGLAIRSAGLDIISDSLVPMRLPNLVPGVPVVVRGRYRGQAAGGVRIEGRGGDGDAWRQKVEAVPVSSGCHGSLWARGKLRHLEDLYAADEHAAGWTSSAERIVELSKAFGVLCRFTALVAIDPRQPDRKLMPGGMRRIVQPVEMACPPPSPAMAPAFSQPMSSWACLSFSDGSDLGFEDGGDDTASPEVARVEAANILAKARPWTGKFGPSTARRTRGLLTAVRRFLGSLVAAGAPRPTIEALSRAYERLRAMPADRDAMVALLDTLAEIAGLPQAADHWWRASAIGPAAQGGDSAIGTAAVP